MTRWIVLFAAMLSVGLLAGASFAVSLYFNPAGMPAAFYVETMQHAIRAFIVPLPALLILGLFFTIISTYLARDDRGSFWLLIVTSLCLISVGLITAFGNVPINNQILTWNISSPPSDWMDLGAKWLRFHMTRTILQICGFGFLTLALLVRRDASKRAGAAMGK